MNQVYLYSVETFAQCTARGQCLNPFMNQVYLYVAAASQAVEAAPKGLNPFMNQVYLYRNVSAACRCDG